MSESSRWHESWCDYLMTADFTLGVCWLSQFFDWVIILLQKCANTFNPPQKNSINPLSGYHCPPRHAIYSGADAGVYILFFHVFTRIFPFQCHTEGQGGICMTHAAHSYRVSGFLQRNCPSLTVPRFALKCLSLKGKKQEKPLPRTLVCPSVCKVFVSHDGSFLEDHGYHFNLLCRPLI